MAKNKIVKMRLQIDPGVTYIGIGVKRYLLRIMRQGDRTAGRPLAPVVVINEPTSIGENPSVATAPELNLATHDHDVPEDAFATGLAPDNLPSVD